MALTKLFWVTTPIHTEDWFVVSSSKRSAQKYHENSEGFNPNFAQAEEIAEIPEDIRVKNKVSRRIALNPRHQLIKDLGGNFISESFPRVVNFFGRVFKEGDFKEVILLDTLGHEEGVYVFNQIGTDRFKIGHTNSLKTRFKNALTFNPDSLRIILFMKTTQYKSLEKHLHEVFGPNRGLGEWFYLDKEKLSHLLYILTYIQENAIKNTFTLYNFYPEIYFPEYFLEMDW
jgi:Meiotically up-regulated gene 113